MVPKEDAGAAAASQPSDAGSAASTSPKVANLSALRAAVDRAGPGGVVSLFIRLDPKTAPPTADERKAALASAGFGPQSVAGDIVTLQMPSDRLEALLAIPWVSSVETASVVKPR